MALHRFPGFPVNLYRNAQATELTIKELFLAERVAIGQIKCTDYLDRSPFQDPWMAEWSIKDGKRTIIVLRYADGKENYRDPVTKEPLFTLQDELETAIKKLITEKLEEYLANC